MKMRTPDVHTHIRLHKTVWVKEGRDVPQDTHVWLSWKHNEDEDPPTSLIQCLSMHLSPLRKIYSQYRWEPTTDCQVKS